MRISKHKNVEMRASLNTGRGNVFCIWIGDEANLFFDWDKAAQFFETVTGVTLTELDRPY